MAFFVTRMHLFFTKYQGTGNDFILIDNRENVFPGDIETIKKLTDRKFGIGADGLILIEKDSLTDFRMVYYNADGSQSLCGNGSRCAVDFARSLGLISAKTTFETTDGIHQAFFREERIYFQLHDVDKIEKISEQEYFIDTGSPHHIRFVSSIEDTDVVTTGAEIRYSEKYPNGANINFVEKENGFIRVRTYERGVENETLSCGTGVTAAALASALEGYSSPVNIKTTGGELTVTFEQVSPSEFKNIYLAGPAQKVFEGKVEI